MNPSKDCERVRLQLMAALDGEAPAADPSDARQHLAACTSCGRWWQDLQAMNSRFQGVSYPGAQPDLWAAVDGRLSQPGAASGVTYPVWLVVGIVVGWRALQLVIDLPFPVLHPVVPLAGAIAALWLIARDPFAIETFAPELQNRGA